MREPSPRSVNLLLLPNMLRHLLALAPPRLPGTAPERLRHRHLVNGFPHCSISKTKGDVTK
jgi:hypothetical protein